MADVLIVVHVLAAAAWLGGSLLSAFVGRQLARAGEAASPAWAARVADAPSNGKTAAIWGAVSTALLVVDVVVMVLKTGSG